MATWKIPVVWQMAGTVEIEAKTLEEAMMIAEDDEGVIPIPDDGDFVDGSWELDCTCQKCVRELYNNNQKDEEEEEEEYGDTV